MPIYEVELADGRVFEVDSDQPPTEQDVLASLGGSAPEPTAAAPSPEEQGSGGASATIGALRTGPAIKQGIGRFAANHPAATQKAIGAGISTAAGGVGAAVGGVPGAVVGASIRGVTPTQAAIREGAGRMAGEAPAVARNAGRAVAVANYGKEMGLPVKPTDLISTGTPAKGFDAYADSMGQRAPRVLDQYGKVVYGPEAPPKPKTGGRLLTGAKAGAGAVARGLAAISGPVGMTDLAQTIEPHRRDIGVMGIGSSVPDPSPGELAHINQRNIQGVHDRQAQQAQQWEQLRAAILSRLGLQ